MFYVDIYLGTLNTTAEVMFEIKKTTKLRSMSFHSIEVSCCILYPYKCLRKTHFKTQWRGEESEEDWGQRGLIISDSSFILSRSMSFLQLKFHVDFML